MFNHNSWFRNPKINTHLLNYSTVTKFFQRVVIIEPPFLDSYVDWIVGSSLSFLASHLVSIEITGKENLSLNDIKFKKESNSVITAIYDKNSHKFDDIINVLKTNNIEILDILTEDSDLEDVFVQLTKN